jgi:hypothetical protein
LNASFNGIARSNTGGTAFAPYAVSVVNRSELTEPNHVLDQGFTIELSPSWNFHADYRYTRFDIDSEGTFRSVNNGTPLLTGATACIFWMPHLNMRRQNNSWYGRAFG